MNDKRRKTFILTTATVGIALVFMTAAWGVSACPPGDVLNVSISLTPASQTEAQTSPQVSSAEGPASSADSNYPSSSSAASNSALSSSVASSSASASSSSAASASSGTQQVQDQQAEEGQYAQETGEEQPEYYDEYYEYEEAQEATPAAGGSSKAKSQRANRKPVSSSGNQAQPSVQTEPNMVWVEPVYEDVYHEERGHWETRTREVTKVICGGSDHNPGDPNYNGPFGGPSPIFDDYNGWKAHQDAFIREMRKEDPYYVCTGRHRPAMEITKEETYEEYVVDEAAWTEQVLVSEGHWEYQ